MQIKPTKNSLTNIYSGGDWDVKIDDGNEFYLQSQRSAVEIVDDFKEGEATYTVWKKNDFKSLPEEEQKARSEKASKAGLETALKTVVGAGLLGMVGTLVMGVIGQVGSLASTVMGGSGAVSPDTLIGLGLGAAIVGGAALIMGISTYRFEKFLGLNEIVHTQTGTARSVKDGFEFYPKEGSKDMTPVLITKKAITPLSELKEGKSD